jgi:hypothetical protein
MLLQGILTGLSGLSSSAVVGQEELFVDSLSLGSTIFLLNFV